MLVAMQDPVTKLRLAADLGVSPAQASIYQRAARLVQRCGVAAQDTIDAAYRIEVDVSNPKTKDFGIQQRDRVLNASTTKAALAALRENRLDLKAFAHTGTAVANDASRPRELKPGLVYLVRISTDDSYKIGVTANLEQRLHDLRAELGVPIDLVHSLKTDDMYGVEQYWHRRFATKWTGRRGERFRLTGDDVEAFRRRGAFM